ncbi:MAG TPA: PQQ-binding-like beta-propeller repeat protein [Thermoguttaceae bacterium]|nr:PQQ-binding-like beta-propeller repeat protein [Thermoguttaceae bacterium]
MSIPRLPASLCVLMALVGSLSPCATVGAGADEAFWPQFHGPNRDNISIETGLLKRWPEGGPKLLWTASGLGHGFATVAIADGRIYTAGNVGEDTVVTAMDMGGRVVWRAKNGRAWSGSQPGSRSTPTLDGDRLYHESPHGDVACFDAKTGRPIWGVNVLEKFHSENVTWALAESLLVDGDRVICRPGGREVSFVALDKRTGEVVWTSPTTGDLAGYSSTALAEWKGVRMLLALSSQALISANADTGERLFRFEQKTPFDENIGTPIYHDGHVFICTRTTGSVMLRLDVDGGRASVEEVWRNTDLDNQHGGVVLLDGYLYGSSHVNSGGKWICVDWRTGRTMYVAEGIGPKGSLTYADGLLCVLGERGDVGLVKPTPTAHEIVSRFKIPQNGKGPTWAHPVVCGGRLYVRHSDFLYTYDVGQ